MSRSGREGRTEECTSHRSVAGKESVGEEGPAETIVGEGKK